MLTVSTLLIVRLDKLLKLLKLLCADTSADGQYSFDNKLRRVADAFADDQHLLVRKSQHSLPTVANVLTPRWTKAVLGDHRCQGNVGAWHLQFDCHHAKEEAQSGAKRAAGDITKSGRT
jgi:hypothetical protein